MKKDIIIKRYGEHTTIWVSERYILDNTNITKQYLDMRARPYYTKHGNTWRWCRIGTAFYYEYGKMPNKAPNFYQTSIGSEDELRGIAEGWGMSDSEIMAVGRDNILRAISAYNRIDALGHYNKRYRGEEKHQLVMELAESWAWCKFLQEYTDKSNKLWIRLGLDHIKDVYKIVAGILREKKLYGLKISNEIGLMNRMKRFNTCKSTEEELLQFGVKGEGNENARNDTKLIEQVALYFRSLPYNWSDAMVVRKTHDFCELQNLKKPSERKLEVFLNEKPQLTMTEKLRFGSKSRFRRITSRTIPIALPLFASDAWQADGTRVNMLDHDGKYLYIVVIRDIKSRAILRAERY